MFVFILATKYLLFNIVSLSVSKSKVGCFLFFSECLALNHSMFSQLYPGNVSLFFETSCKIKTWILHWNIAKTWHGGHIPYENINFFFISMYAVIKLLLLIHGWFFSTYQYSVFEYGLHAWTYRNKNRLQIIFVRYLFCLLDQSK